MDEELKLPENLNGISNLEKQELLRFKKTHTEVKSFQVACLIINVIRLNGKRSSCEE